MTMATRRKQILARYQSSGKLLEEDTEDIAVDYYVVHYQILQDDGTGSGNEVALDEHIEGTISTDDEFALVSYTVPGITPTLEMDDGRCLRIVLLRTEGGTSEIVGTGGFFRP
jgi:hypothetical protein